METSIIFKTDSYKVTHHPMYPDGMTGMHSYFEARPGASHDRVMFVGLQAILMEHLVGTVVTKEAIAAAEQLFGNHLGPGLFNKDAWLDIVHSHKGRLPVKIRAVREGSVHQPGTVLMTVENTDPKHAWLVNYLETLFSQVWYPCTVGTVSWTLKQKMLAVAEAQGAPVEAVDFMLHDFGCRGVSSMGSAALGGLAHIVNYSGTDTVPALIAAQQFYRAGVATAFSVPASEHSVMTSRGVGGDIRVLDELLDAFPTGVLSVVADSFNVYEFVDAVCERKDRILARDGKVVIRPDSNTPQHPLPEDQMVWILDRLHETFGGTLTDKGFVMLDPHVGVLWGDGIDPDGIMRIIEKAGLFGYAATNMVFGMGGGLLQKVNRDTERFAFKASAIEVDGRWVPVTKQPLDASKVSKAGRFDYLENLEVVFEDGALIRYQTFDDVRAEARVGV